MTTAHQRRPGVRGAPRLLPLLVLLPIAAAQDAASTANGAPPVVTPGRPSPGWQEVSWLETRMHLRHRPAPGGMDDAVTVVSLEPASTTAKDDAIAAETAALQRAADGARARRPLRVWLRADAEAAFRAPDRVALDGTAPAGAVLFRAYGFDGERPRRVVLDGRGVVRRVIDGRLGSADVRFVRALLLEPPTNSPLVGHTFPRAAAGAARRLSGEPLIAAGRWTLLRWWTDGCPYCEASLPDLDTLRPRFPQLDIVAVHHPKPPAPTTAEAIRDAAARRSFAGILATDAPRWLTFRGLRALGLERGPTSIALLVGPDRTIRWVHPGPRLHRSADGAHPGAQADFVQLETMLTALFSDDDTAGDGDGDR